MRTRHAFTLIELLVVIAIIALLIGILLPAIGRARDTAKNVLSQTRMRQLTQGAANYAADNSDRIFSYTWRGPPSGDGGFFPSGIRDVVFFYMPDGKIRRAVDDTQASRLQQMEILMRVTGRIDGENRFDIFSDHLVQLRWNHTVLLDYLGVSQPEPIAASPFDRNLIEWQANPLDITAANNIPYAPGSDYNDYDDSDGWRSVGTRQRWAYASSYQTVPVAWNSDGIGTGPTHAPIGRTPHRTEGSRNLPVDKRLYTEVAYPASKVLQYEEFDRFSSRQALYYFYPDAATNVSFFDGSVRRERTRDANPGWNPAQPDQEWHQRYVPLHTFPAPKTGFGEMATYCVRYRWTRHGLRGIDFGGSEIGRPEALGPASTANCGN